MPEILCIQVWIMYGVWCDGGGKVVFVCEMVFGGFFSFIRMQTLQTAGLQTAAPCWWVSSEESGQIKWGRKDTVTQITTIVTSAQKAQHTLAFGGPFFHWKHPPW